VRVAAVQVGSVALQVPARAAHALRTLQTCANEGAGLVLFPELYLGGYTLDQRLAHNAEQAERALPRLQAAVDELDLSAVLGLPLRRGEALLNAVAVVRPRTPAAIYAKTHLFRTEKEWFAAGAELWAGPVAGWPCGLAVCYELGFPEIARVLALRGARLLLAPSAFGARRQPVWRTATVARALENGCYLVAANHTGPHEGGAFLGLSRIVDPRGSIVAEAPDGDSVVFADLDEDLVDEARAGGPDGGGHTYFADRRPELYGDISRPAE
jgi:omega-amidase